MDEAAPHGYDTGGREPGAFIGFARREAGRC